MSSPYTSHALGNLQLSPIRSGEPVFRRLSEQLPARSADGASVGLSGYETNEQLRMENRVLSERLDQLWRLYFQNKSDHADLEAQQQLVATATDLSAVQLREELNTSKQLIGVLLTERKELLGSSKQQQPSKSSSSSRSTKKKKKIKRKEKEEEISTQSDNGQADSDGIAEEEKGPQEEEEEEERDEEEQESTQTKKEEEEEDANIRRSYKVEADALRQLKDDLDRKIDALTSKYDAKVSETQNKEDEQQLLAQQLLASRESLRVAQRERDAALKENIDLQSTVMANRMAHEEATMKLNMKHQQQLREYEAAIARLQINAGEAKALSTSDPNETRALTLRIYDLDKQRTVMNEKLRRMSEALAAREHECACLHRDVEAMSKFISSYKSEHETNQLLLQRLKAELAQARETERLKALELQEAHNRSIYYKQQSSQLLHAHQSDVSNITQQYVQDLDTTRHSLSLARSEVIALQGEKDALARKVRRAVLENETLRYSADHSLRHPMRSEV